MKDKNRATCKLTIGKLAKLRAAGVRSTSGAAVIVLVMMLGICIIGVIGLFSFEVTRNNSARDELQSACEAAALACASALASSNDTAAANCHSNAETAADQAFVCNSILGVLLSDTNFMDSQSSSAAAARVSNPAANWANLYIEFLDSSGIVAPWNQATGRTVHIIGVFGEVPCFAKYEGLQKVNVVTEATAQVPQMDIMMCFDVSSSIDDQSMSTFVRRWWNGSAIQYDVATTTSGSPGRGTLYGVLQPTPLGTSVNVEKPQALDVSTSSVNASKMTFNGTLRQGPSGGDTGQPPGNYGGGSAGANTDFTDLVLNLDGNAVFAGFSYTDPTSGHIFQFPNLATLVEAARGNLENPTVFASSKANTGPASAVTPTAGYQSAYWAACHAGAQPIGAARAAAENFFNIMDDNTNGLFGFLSFGNVPPATLPTETNPTTNAIASGYSAGGTVTPPYPGSQLGANPATFIRTNLIPLTVANGCTDMGGALQEAVNELIANGRPGANKAIVFFTDGQSNCGPSWNSAAALAKTNGIAIYSVGLAQNAAIIPAECENLNDQSGVAINYTDPITGASSSYTPSGSGMSAVAQNGGKFFLVTNKGDLNFVFENIARQLVQLSVR